MSRDMWGGGGVLEGARDTALCVWGGGGRGTAKGTWIYAQGRFSLCLRGVCACTCICVQYARAYERERERGRERERETGTRKL